MRVFPVGRGVTTYPYVVLAYSADKDSHADRLGQAIDDFVRAQNAFKVYKVLMCRLILLATD